jgi:hypothetical protein
MFLRGIHTITSSVREFIALEFQYFSLPHLFLPDSGSPVGFLPDSYWISTIFPKRHFNTFFQFPSYWTPTRLLLDSYWTPTGLLLDLNKIPESECNASDIGFLPDSYWIPTGV